jgi:transcriptional regulator with XRE-family HTH domain
VIAGKVGRRHTAMGRLGNYLRSRRRQWHLTQGELAFLFGYTDESIVSRLERQERTVTLAVAHACELIFGYDAEEIFPALFAEVEDGVVARLHELQDRLSQGKATKLTAAKLQLLDAALARASGELQPSEL